MSRFNTDTFRSLNESIARVQNPQAALAEAMEYTAILEEVILSICEELELDPQALVEDALTNSGAAVLVKRKKKAEDRSDKADSMIGNQEYGVDRVRQGTRKQQAAATRASRSASKNWSKVHDTIRKLANSKTVYTAGKGGKLKKAAKGTRPTIKSEDEFHSVHRYS